MCPFVPFANTTLEDCVRCSKSLSEQLAKELGVPVYLYEASQERDYRRSLQSIRKGEYKELQEKVSTGVYFLKWWLFLILNLNSMHTFLLFYVDLLDKLKWCLFLSGS